MVRVMLEKVEEKLAKYHQDNKLVKAAMCVCKCCFWCLTILRSNTACRHKFRATILP